MAEMNLLKSTFTGTLGRVTGSNWKGKPVVKAKIFSKAPPSNAQTQSVRAFEALNRLSAAIAKEGFQYMGLSQKTLLPHNAVARFLKPVIKNHHFDIANAKEIIKKDGSQSILYFVYNKSKELGTLKIGLGPDFVPLTGTKTFINVFNQNGISFFSDIIDTSDYLLSFFMPYSPENQYNAMIFMSEPAYKGVFLHGLDYRKGAGMQYSLDEQLTGDAWLNGEPIYQKSFLVNTGPTGKPDDIPHGITGNPQAIRFEATMADSTGQFVTFMPYIGPINQSTNFNLNYTNLSFTVGSTSLIPNHTLKVTIFYIKTA